MAAEVLRRAVHDEVGAVLERAEVDGGRRGRVDDDAAGMRGGRLEVGHGQERVRRRLQPDRGRRRRRRAGLVELDEAQAPALECVEEHAGAVVAPSASAIVWPGSRSASTSAVTAPVPDGKSSASPPSSSPSARSAATPSGGRSAGSRARRARRPGTARSSSGRAAARRRLYGRTVPI